MQLPWPRLALCAALCACGWAHAGENVQPECRADLPQGHPLANRSGTISSMERMPESCLKSFLAECSETANERLLDLGSAAVCSMGYEALLHKSFGGSFHAMMVWWKREHEVFIP